MHVIKNLKIYKPIRQWRISRTVNQWTDGDVVKLNFYKPLIETGSVVFDVGANIGKRTKVFLKLGARVVAIEPQKECAQILHLAFGNKIILVQKGLAEKEGFGEIRLDQSTTLSSMSNEWIEAVKTSGRFKDHIWPENNK